MARPWEKHENGRKTEMRIAEKWTVAEGAKQPSRNQQSVLCGESKAGAAGDGEREESEGKLRMEKFVFVWPINVER